MATAVPGRRAVALQHRGAEELELELELDPELKMDGETCRQSSWASVAVSAVFVRCRSRAGEQTPTECNIHCAIGCGGKGFVRDARVVVQLAAVSGAVRASQWTGRDMTAPWT